MYQPTRKQMLNLDLPFVCHHTDGNDVSGPCYIVWTTCNGEDTVDHVCVVDIHDDDKGGKRAGAIAQFVADALNRHVMTEEGLKKWKKIHATLPIASSTK